MSADAIAATLGVVACADRAWKWWYAHHFLRRWRPPADTDIPDDSLGASIRRGLALVTPESGNHRIDFSPNGRYFVDVYSGIEFRAGSPEADRLRAILKNDFGKDVREQTRNVLERIKTILTAAGTSLDNVLTATTHLTNVANLAAYNEEYAKYFPTNKPARTTVTVAALNAPELLVEITVIAGIPD